MAWTDLNMTWHFVEKWALEKPEAEALVFGEERLSWGEFKEHVDRISRAFLDIGVVKGDRIALLSSARNEFLLSYMAAGKIGAMWFGLNPKFTLEELRYQLTEAKPRILIAVRTFQGKDLGETIVAIRDEFHFIEKILIIGDPLEGTENFGNFVNKPRPELDECLRERAGETAPTAKALLIFTSGSTGKAKGVVHNHISIVESIKVEIEKFCLDQDVRCLLQFPINHVAADVDMGFAVVMAGGTLVSLEQFDPVISLRTIAEEKITMFGQVPVMYLLQMKQKEFSMTDFSHVRTMVWGGAAAPRAMVEALSTICEKVGAMLITCYGSTETCGFITYTQRGEGLEVLSQTVGAIARPFQLKIVDQDRREIPMGNVGEIAVKGEFMFQEYLNNSSATAAVLDEEGWFYTSDLASMDQRGYISIVGRISEMYKSGGENVYPREIEELLDTHKDVLLSVVIGVPDELYQEVGWAFIIPRSSNRIGEDALRDFCRSTLANYKVPKRFIFREALPLLPTGKVDKMALKEEIKAILDLEHKL